MPDRTPLPAALLAAGLAAGLLAGCGKAPTGPKDDKAAAAVKGDPWKAAEGRLKKETDPSAVRAALTALTADLSAEGKDALPPVSEGELTALAGLVPLTAGDKDEVRSATFTAHDAVYVADCLYLRDAARSLDLGRLKPERRAELAFAWVCRQVYLHPWVTIPNQAAGGTALPPVPVLRRGSGSGLERMYIFLALLQQLELHGCLIGPPDAGTQPAGLPVVTADKKAYVTGAPRGPFWAVGVQVGTDVKLFDPWRGQPFPVTLNELRKNPDAAKDWFADPANVSGVTLDDVKKFAPTAYLAVPVNALAPRMAAAEAKLGPALGVNLSVDAKALRAAFPDPKPAFWNPPDNPNLPGAFAYGRAARSLLPVEDGGADRGPVGGRLYDEFRRNQLPPSVFALPPGLDPGGPIALRLRAGAVTALGASFIEPPNPRERIQRGQFQDAARELVVKQGQFASGLERLERNPNAGQQIRDWVAEANRLYDDYGRARLDKDQQAEASASAAIDAHWRQFGGRFVVDRAASAVGLAEATLLLALCKHEQAERAQTRADSALTKEEAARLGADAVEGWKTAAAAWRNYEQQSSAHAAFPGRVEHARALAARAEQMAAPK